MLRGRISRYKNAFNTNRFIDILDQLVDGYNKSFHSSIKMTPYSVNKDNERDVYNNLYLGKIEIKKKAPYQFKVGGSVLISEAKQLFSKETYERWTKEIFTVSKRYRNSQNFNIYILKDCTGDDISGTFFEPELSGVYNFDNQLYKIETYLDEATINCTQHILVKWEDFPSKCATWIKKSLVVGI